MEIGMLWYDAGPAALKDRVLRAADYYAEKHGHKPNLCMVHPDMIEGKEGKFNGILVRSKRGVMPGHMWIGLDESLVKTNGSKGNGARSKTKSSGAKSSSRKAPKVASRTRKK